MNDIDLVRLVLVLRHHICEVLAILVYCDYACIRILDYNFWNQFCVRIVHLYHSQDEIFVVMSVKLLIVFLWYFFIKFMRVSHHWRDPLLMLWYFRCLRIFILFCYRAVVILRLPRIHFLRHCLFRQYVFHELHDKLRVLGINHRVNDVAGGNLELNCVRIEI